VKSVDPVIVTATVFAFVVPTSPDTTVPVNVAVTTPVVVMTIGIVPLKVPALAQFAAGVMVAVVVTDGTVVVVTADIELMLMPAAPVTVAVPVLVTDPPANAFVAQEYWAMNWKTAVPCSVTVAVDGIVVVIKLGVVPLPKLTLENVAPGPNPVAVAVTNVPTGPEVGDRVKVGAFRLKVAVAVFPRLSVKRNVFPEVIPGRLTVAVILPVVAEIESELIVDEEPVAV